MKIKKLIKCISITCAIIGAGLVAKSIYDKKQKEHEESIAEDDEDDFYKEEEVDSSCSQDERVYHELRKFKEAEEKHEECIEELKAAILKSLDVFCAENGLCVNHDNIGITFVEGDIDATTKSFRITDTDVYGVIHPVTLEVELHRDTEVI